MGDAPRRRFGFGFAIRNDCQVRCGGGLQVESRLVSELNLEEVMQHLLVHRAGGFGSRRRLGCELGG